MCSQESPSGILTIFVRDKSEEARLKVLYSELHRHLRYVTDAQALPCGGWIYRPEPGFTLHEANLRQVLFYLHKYPQTECLVLSFGLLDLPFLGAGNNLQNNLVYLDKGSGQQLLPEKIKVLRLFSETPDQTVQLSDVIGIRVLLNGYGMSAALVKSSSARASTVYQSAFVKQKKLVFVFPTFLAVGGAERNTLEVIRQLASEYHFVVVTFARLTQDHGSLHREFQQYSDAVFDLTEISTHSDILNSLGVLKSIYDPDIIWICNGSPWLSENLESVSLLFDQATIVDQQAYDVHQGWINHFRNNTTARKLVDRYIAVNSGIHRVYVNELGIAENRVRLIYPMIRGGRFDKSDYQERLAELRSDSALEQQQNAYVFVGRLCEQKRPVLFLQMVRLLASRLPDTRFYMLGSGPLAADVDACIQRYQLGNRVTRVAFTDNIAEILAIARGLIITSAYEGLPIAMLEAMCMELPVFSTDVGDIKRVIAEFGNGEVVDTESEAESLAAAFLNFHRKVESGEYPVVNAARHIRQRFSERAVVHQYRKVFSLGKAG